MRSEQNYSSKTDFETRRENKDFGRQNNSMSRPPLDSTSLGTNTTNGTMSPIDSIPVRTKTTEPTPQTRPTYLPALPADLPEQNGKAHVPGDPDTDPSLSDSSSSKYNFLGDINSSKSNKRNSMRRKSVRKTRNKTRQAHC